MIEVRTDNLGSRFVKIEGLERDVYEVETLPARFLLEALGSGAHLKMPKNRSAQKQWDRNIDLTILNYFGKEEGDEPLSSGFSHQQIGGLDPERPIGRERVRQVVSKTIKSLHFNCPDYLKQKYPLKEILDKIDRPYFMINHAGITRQIAEASLKGASYEDLRKRGYSNESLSQPRSILSDYHLKVSYDPGWNRHLTLVDDLKAVKADDPKDNKQQLLERITPAHFDRIKEFKTYCLTVSDLIREAGLHFTNRKKGGFNLVLQSLSEAGINWRAVPHEVKSGPQQGFIYYHIILAVDKEEALQILQNDPRLEPLRREIVQQVLGERVDRLPTSWELVKHKGYQGVGSLVRQLGQRGGRRGFNMMQILEGCQVPVFVLKNKSGYYYPINRGEQLEEFLKSKLTARLSP